nr:nonstructural protein NS4A [Lammi virus]
SYVPLLEVMGRMPQHFTDKTIDAVDTFKTVLTATPGSRAYRLAIDNLPDAAETFLFVLMIGFMTMGILVFLMAPKGVTRMSLGFMTIMAASYFLWVSGMAGYQIAAMQLVSFIMFVVLVPEPGSQR